MGELADMPLGSFGLTYPASSPASGQSLGRPSTVLVSQPWAVWYQWAGEEGPISPTKCHLAEGLRGGA